MKGIIWRGILISLLIFSCSENNIIEPVGELHKPNLNFSSHKDIINLCCPLQDPLSGPCNLIGEVVYFHQVQSVNNGVFKVRVLLDMSTELCDMFGMMHPEWSVVLNTEDFVYVSEEGITILEKSYEVCNRNDIGVRIQYIISTEGVGVGVVEIEKLDPVSISETL